jgi:hypothetical protein
VGRKCALRSRKGGDAIFNSLRHIKTEFGYHESSMPYRCPQFWTESHRKRLK